LARQREQDRADKPKREDGTFPRENFTFNQERDIYTCPAGKHSR
jgi:hypothetical protein